MSWRYTTDTIYKTDNDIGFGTLTGATIGEISVMFRNIKCFLTLSRISEKSTSRGFTGQLSFSLVFLKCLVYCTCKFFLV